MKKVFRKVTRWPMAYLARGDKRELTWAGIAWYGERVGLYALSAMGFRLARRALLKRDNSTAFSRHLHYQFWEVRARHRSWLLSCVHHDPLFDCEATPSTGACSHERGCIRPEWFAYAWTALGLRIWGELDSSCSANQLMVMIDGREVRSVKLARPKRGGMSFRFHLRREVLSELPASCELSLQLPDGQCVSCGSVDSLLLVCPHGSGELARKLDAGWYIDKKGYLNAPVQPIEERQGAYLAIYEQARRHFDEHAGSPLFLLYGTLLGCVRDGDFIPGDDDFDAGYVSHCTDVDAVREETKQLVVELVLAGFVCSFNRAGRLFRLRRPSDPVGIHLDVRPVWYESGRIWAHKQASLELTIEDFLPVEQRVLRGTKVYLPRWPERFLEAYYGKGWRVPDPSYSNASNPAPASVKKKLERLCIRPSDYFEIQRVIEVRRGENPGAGCLIADGLFPLYPLEAYEAHCEW